MDLGIKFVFFWMLSVLFLSIMLVVLLLINSFGCFWFSGFRNGFSSPINEDGKSWAGVLPSAVGIEVS